MKNDGGQAFPYVENYYEGRWAEPREFSGMSLRDYFAAHAREKDYWPYQRMTSLSASEAKYRYADAMIAAREV